MRTGPSKLMAEEIAHALESLGPVHVTRFFGGAGLKLDGVQFGFVMKAVLYLRVSDATRGRYIQKGSAPFCYTGRFGPVVVESYYAAPPEIVEEPTELRNWAVEACAAAPARRASAARKSGRASRSGRNDS